VSTTIVIDAEDVTELVPAAPPPAKKRGMLIPAAIGGLVALAGIGGGGYYLLSGPSAHAKPTAASAEVTPQSYVDVPGMVVNLRSTDGRTRFVKLHFMLVVAESAKADAVKAKLPVYLDALQPFLRELRPEDLNGSAAIYRMKEEMMVRANDALGAGTVQDVLIQDLVQQ
jgi:flagellar protein FliL